jgi:hypothetical protein
MKAAPRIVATALDAPRALPRSWGAIVQRARGTVTWKHWAWAAGVAAAVSLSMPFQHFDNSFYWAAPRVLYHTPWYLLFAFVFVVAIALAEATAPRLRPTIGRYAVAAIAAGLACIALSGIFSHVVQRPPERVVEGRMDRAPRTVRWEINHRYMTMTSLGLDGAFYGFLAMFIYVRLRNARLAAQALAQAEIERSEAQRVLLAAQLVAARAQLDPAFVVKALDRIEQAYESDPARAERLLDEFIVFLRAAIPRIRDEEKLQAP